MFANSNFINVMANKSNTDLIIINLRNIQFANIIFLFFPLENISNSSVILNIVDFFILDLDSVTPFVFILLISFVRDICSDRLKLDSLRGLEA
jgi:hypothetical protein